jgi:hypothetical protein
MLVLGGYAMDSNAKRYREIAEEVRSTADRMTDAENRQMLLSVVADYEHMAKMAEQVAKSRNVLANTISN